MDTQHMCCSQKSKYQLIKVFGSTISVSVINTNYWDINYTKTKAKALEWFSWCFNRKCLNQCGEH